ncbi:hypothetical protein ACS0TY_023262 [Phlomoides rotata]
MSWGKEIQEINPFVAEFDGELEEEPTNNKEENVDEMSEFKSGEEEESVEILAYMERPVMVPVLSSVVSFSGPNAAEMVMYVDRNLKMIAPRVLEKANEICTFKSNTDAICESVDGDPRNVLCKTVDKYHASVRVIGGHGYGVLKLYQSGLRFTSIASNYIFYRGATQGQGRQLRN